MQPFTKVFKRGTNLFHENDHSRELYIISTGSVKIYRTVGSREVELAVLKKGSVLGEMALIEGKPRSASARAEEDSTVIIIDADTFLDTIKGVPPWFLTIIRMVSQKIRAANKRLDAARNSNPASIVLAIFYSLKQSIAFPDGKDGISLDKTRNRTIQLLAITQNRVVAILDFLQRNNFIECTGQTIRVLDIARFENYCSFLRFHLHNGFDKLANQPASFGTAVSAVIDAAPEVIIPDSKQVSLPGEAIGAALMASLTQQDQVDRFVETCKQLGLLKLQKIEGAPKTQVPLSGFMAQLETEGWLKWRLYNTFKGMVPS